MADRHGFADYMLFVEGKAVSFSSAISPRPPTSLSGSGKKVWQEVDRLVDCGNALLEGRRLDDAKVDLFTMIEPDTPLQRVAHTALRGRRDVKWVRDWLEEIETTL